MNQRLLDPRIRLRHIVCFLEVVRSKSMAGAAEALHISQPAATKTIQELEAILGEKLFDRTRRRLTLTAVGDVFSRYASTGITALRQGLMAAQGSGETALVRVGALPTVSARILPKVVEAFKAERSGGTTRIITGPNGYLLSLLRTGEVDIVIGRMAEPKAMMGLSFEHLYSEPVVLAVRPGHPLLAVPDFHLSQIVGFQALTPTPDSVIRPIVEQILLASGVSGLADQIETVSNAFGRSYVRQTDAIWFISEGVVAEDVADGQIRLLPVNSHDTMGPVGLTTRIQTEEQPEVERFIEHVRAVAASFH
jgi:LysR family transcriptional regulator, pca operon transcriptional activator